MVVKPRPAVGLERAPSLPDRWRLVRFDQMAECVTDRVDNPAEAGVERYVGLEHLDPESLRIRRWGSPTDVEATKLCFKPGDIIFGRRRAYQHKLAVADFEGICSAHAMVLRAREDVVIKEFLPLLMQSDLFFDRALAISVGSLSPTINWRTLARQEFPLPPKEEQRRIAEILWAADETTQCYIRAQQHAELSVRLTSDSILKRLYDSRESDAYPSKELAAYFERSPESGHSAVASSVDTGFYVLTLTALGPNGYERGNFKPVGVSPKSEAARLRKGDFLISRSNTRDLVGFAGIFDEDAENVTFSDLMMRLHIREVELDKRFLQLLLLSSRGRAHIMSVAAGTSASMKKINRRGLGKFVVVCPPKSVQLSVVETVQELRRPVVSLTQHIKSTRALLKALLNQLLGGCAGDIQRS